MPDLIPEELKAFIELEIASGKYRNEEEVVSAALRLLQERERKLESLQADLQEGVSELDRGERLNGEEVFQELREQIAEHEDRKSGAVSTSLLLLDEICFKYWIISHRITHGLLLVSLTTLSKNVTRWQKAPTWASRAMSCYPI